MRRHALICTGDKAGSSVRLPACISVASGTILDDPGQYLRAREGECELGTLAIGKTVSGTDFGDRMGAW